MNQSGVEVLLVLALLVPTNEEKGLAFFIEIVKNAKGVGLGPCPELLEVVDLATLQGIRMGPAELGAKLLKEEDLGKKGFLCLGRLGAEPIEVLIGGGYCPHTSNMLHSSYAVKFIRGNNRKDGLSRSVEGFFVNIHGEAKYFLADDSLAFSTAASHDAACAAAYAGAYAGAPYNIPAGSAAAATAFTIAAYPLTNTKTEYGVRTFFEFEPHAK